MELDATQFTEQEIADAQAQLDLQPNNSPYWDSGAGQDDLEIIHTLGLKPSTTNAERVASWREYLATEDRA